MCPVEMEGHSDYSLEFPANPGGVGWSGDALDVQGAASERFQGLEEVGVDPAMLGRGMGNGDRATLGDS